MNYNQLKLINQLCFPLYACSRQLVKKYKPYLNEIGLTYTQYIVLLVLWETSPITVKALGDMLYLDSGTLTPLLKRLEADGIITRARSKDDERNLVVTLTKKGEEIKHQAKDIPYKIKSCINLSDEDHKTFYRIINNVLKEI